VMCCISRDTLLMTSDSYPLAEMTFTGDSRKPFDHFLRQETTCRI